MTPEDERIDAWHELAAHPFFQDAYKDEVPLLASMLKRLDNLMTKPETENATQAEEPVEWRIGRAFANGYREGMDRAFRGPLDHC